METDSGERFWKFLSIWRALEIIVGLLELLVDDEEKHPQSKLILGPILKL